MGTEHKEILDMPPHDRREFFELFMGLTIVATFFALAVGVLHHWQNHELTRNLLIETRRRDITNLETLRGALMESETERASLVRFVDAFLEAHPAKPDDPPAMGAMRKHWESARAELSSSSGVVRTWTGDDTKAMGQLVMFYDERDWEAQVSGLTFIIHIIMVVLALGCGAVCVVVYARRRHIALGGTLKRPLPPKAPNPGLPVAAPEAGDRSRPDAEA